MLMRMGYEAVPGPFSMIIVSFGLFGLLDVGFWLMMMGETHEGKLKDSFFDLWKTHKAGEGVNI